MNLSLEEIKAGLASGEFFLSGKKIYSRQEWAQIKEAERQEEHYDLLQLTKKIQL